MRPLLRAAALMSSLALLACGVWLAHLQAQAGPAGLPTGTGDVASGAAQRPPKPTVMLSTSKAFSGPVIQADMLLLRELSAGGAQGHASQAVKEVASGPAKLSEGAPQFALVTPEGSRAAWFQHSLFTGWLFFNDSWLQSTLLSPWLISNGFRRQLPRPSSFDLHPRSAAWLRGTDVMHRYDGEPRTIFELTPSLVPAFRWNELLPEYSQGPDPALGWGMWQPWQLSGTGPLAPYHSTGVLRRLERGLAEDFRQTTQSGNSRSPRLLTPCMFRTSAP